MDPEQVDSGPALTILARVTTSRAPKSARPDAPSVGTLREWLASPEGQARMQRAAKSAENARARIAKLVRVSSDVLRVRVTM